jgi:hypothetical protein
VKRWQASLALALALMQTCGVVFWTLTSNLAAAVYPHDADTITIPLFQTAFVTVVLFSLTQGANGILRSPFSLMRLHRKVVFSLLALLAVFLTVLLILYWAIPNHYAVACAYALLLVVMFTVGIARWRQSSV